MPIDSDVFIKWRRSWTSLCRTCSESNHRFLVDDRVFLTVRYFPSYKWRTIPWKTVALYLSFSTFVVLFKILSNHRHRFSFCLIVVRLFFLFFFHLFIISCSILLFYASNRLLKFMERCFRYSSCFFALASNQAKSASKVDVVRFSHLSNSHFSSLLCFLSFLSLSLSLPVYVLFDFVCRTFWNRAASIGKVADRLIPNKTLRFSPVSSRPMPAALFFARCNLRSTARPCSLCDERVYRFQQTWLAFFRAWSSRVIFSDTILTSLCIMQWSLLNFLTTTRFLYKL